MTRFHFMTLYRHLKINFLSKIYTDIIIKCKVIIIISKEHVLIIMLINSKQKVHSLFTNNKEYQNLIKISNLNNKLMQWTSLNQLPSNNL